MLHRPFFCSSPLISHPFSFFVLFRCCFYLFIISSVSRDTDQFHHSWFPPKAKADLLYKQPHPLFFFPLHNNTKSWDCDPRSFELNEICRPITSNNYILHPSPCSKNIFVHTHCSTSPSKRASTSIISSRSVQRACWRFEKIANYFENPIRKTNFLKPETDVRWTPLKPTTFGTFLYATNVT